MSLSEVRQVSGRALSLRGSDVDTDRIIPARFLKTVTFDGLERGLFADDRAAALRAGTVHPFDAAASIGARILIVGKNFGCGSSREHAPQALYRWGIRAVVAESFAEIFSSNSLMIGLPCTAVAESDLSDIAARVESMPTIELSIDIASGHLVAGDRQWNTRLPEHVRDALVSGHWDGAGLLLDRYEDVEAVASRVPY